MVTNLWKWMYAVNLLMTLATSWKELMSRSPSREFLYKSSSSWIQVSALKGSSTDKGSSKICTSLSMTTCRSSRTLASKAPLKLLAVCLNGCYSLLELRVSRGGSFDEVVDDALDLRVAAHAHLSDQRLDDHREVCRFQLVVFDRAVLLSGVLLDEAEELFELVDVHVVVELFNDLALRRVDPEDLDEARGQTDAIHRINAAGLAAEQLREISQCAFSPITRRRASHKVF